MAKEQVFAVFDTSLGTFTTLLYTEKMPITTQNFIDLVEGNKEFMDPATGQMVKRRFYDGRKIFRVIQGFMFQTGAASDNNRYSSGYSIPDEFHPSLRYDKPGLLAMANAGPNTGSTQFFLTFSGPGCAHLQGKHPIFGEVVEGMEVVRKIEAVPVGGREGSAPLDPPVIDKVTIKRAAQP
ncbi:peptidylprolyl isomerase [Candidatus Sumerlaeota bacterium]|nr:peptidylprolyl isomerase [Candidatus Sumerlaeota bacterium]